MIGTETGGTEIETEIEIEDELDMTEKIGSMTVTATVMMQEDGMTVSTIQFPLFIYLFFLVEHSPVMYVDLTIEFSASIWCFISSEVYKTFFSLVISLNLLSCFKMCVFLC